MIPKRYIFGPLRLALKTAWAVTVGAGVVVGLVTGGYSVLHETGVVESTPAQLIELPANLDKFIEVTIRAGEKYLSE